MLHSFFLCPRTLGARPAEDCEFQCIFTHQLTVVQGHCSNDKIIQMWINTMK
jgi:hypothetical protein